MLRAKVCAPSDHGMRTAWLLIVMPRSRSISIRSRYWARIDRSSTTPVICSIRSASVDLPWSMCAMMQKFRMIAGSVLPGCGATGRLGWDTNLFRDDERDASFSHGSRGDLAVRRPGRGPVQWPA